MVGELNFDSQPKLQPLSLSNAKRYVPTFPISTLQGVPQSATELPYVVE